jgi:glutamyl-tRNA synthetase
MTRVRFAPSPTGYLHVGGARTALFNWLLARHEGGVFLLRIEDTDRARSSAAMTEVILDGLRWLGLDWDGAPEHQADGLERHRADAWRLLETGAAYRCFCTAEQLAERQAAGPGGEAFRYDRYCLERIASADAERRAAAGEPFTVRFRVPAGTTEWDDLVHGVIAFDNAAIEDFIILRSDGTPIYNLAVVSDDIHMRITHVIRGDDHISNTPKQILLYRALGAPLPAFGHVPLILGSDGKRLSKRHGATAIGEYRHQGILPAAMVNFLVLLGWSPRTDEEIFTVDELISRFTIDGINKKSAVFDIQKLLWLNGQHLNRLPADALEEAVVDALADAGLADAATLRTRREWVLRLIDILKPRARTVAEIVAQAGPYLRDSVVYDPDAVAKHWTDRDGARRRLGALAERFSELDRWNEATLESALRSIAESHGEGAGKWIHPLRVALTGSAVSPGIFEVATLMERDLVLDRIAHALHYLDDGAASAADHDDA